MKKYIVYAVILGFAVYVSTIVANVIAEIDQEVASTDSGFQQIGSGAVGSAEMSYLNPISDDLSVFTEMGASIGTNDDHSSAKSVRRTPSRSSSGGAGSYSIFESKNTSSDKTLYSGGGDSDAKIKGKSNVQSHNVGSSESGIVDNTNTMRSLSGMLAGISDKGSETAVNQTGTIGQARLAFGEDNYSTLDGGGGVLPPDEEQIPIDGGSFGLLIGGVILGALAFFKQRKHVSE